jgi:hypothetical protein
MYAVTGTGVGGGAKELTAVFSGDKSLLHPLKYGIIAREISDPMTT